jgi:hypothetical protein
MPQSKRPARYHEPSTPTSGRRLKEKPGVGLNPDNAVTQQWKSAFEEYLASFPQASLFQGNVCHGTLRELGVEMEDEADRLVLTYRQGARTFRRRVIQVWSCGERLLKIDVQHLTSVIYFEIRSESEASVQYRRKLPRRSFQKRLEAAISKNFPKVKIWRSTIHSDLEYSLSGKYVRLRFSSGPVLWDCLAAGPQEDQATIDAALSGGLIWREYMLRQCRRNTGNLLLIVPSGQSLVLRSRLASIRGAGKSIYLAEMNADTGAIAFQDLSDSGNLDTTLTTVHTLRSKPLLARFSGLHRVLEMAPGEIDAVASNHGKSVSFRICGLEFAQIRMDEKEEIFFGVRKQRRLLHWEDLRGLVRQLLEQRAGAAADHNRTFYRLQAERWLESLILHDVRMIDIRLDPEYVYPQVPAFLAGDRGMIDILTVTQQGRLAILELKVSEDIDLPLQGLDYWMRVRWHHMRHEFKLKGYFGGKELSPELPILFFVCPQFRYHSSFSVLLDHLSKQIPVVQIGINENWRAGLQVAMRREWNMRG